MVQVILSGIESVFCRIQLLYCEPCWGIFKFCCRERLVVAFGVFWNLIFTFFCFCFDDLKTFAFVFGGWILRESFGQMIYYIFLDCNLQIIVSEVFCKSIVILTCYFLNPLPYFFWLCVTIYFGNVTSPCISFGVYDDFLGFGSAVFISV